MTRIRRLVAALGVLAAATTGLVLTTAPAQAAGCFQGSCNGKDPNAQGCSGSNLASVNFLGPDARVDLRYSSGCDANWARLVYSGPWNCCVNFTLREEQQRWNGSAWVAYRVKDKSFTYGATQSNIWTLMNPNELNDRHRACVVEENVCTSWVS
jgi:hypothetical protein